MVAGNASLLIATATMPLTLALVIPSSARYLPVTVAWSLGAARYWPPCHSPAPSTYLVASASVPLMAAIVAAPLALTLVVPSIVRNFHLLWHGSWMRLASGYCSCRCSMYLARGVVITGMDCKFYRATCPSRVFYRHIPDQWNLTGVGSPRASHY
ncbi:hypothetical protein J6590_047755 [Homalodisca vitripennis]|nr:hypothetical protein J6590_047755 [Homalodisca vitripennis]